MELTKYLNFQRNFHNTFKPEKHYISSILDTANNNIELSLDEISAKTGIPQGKSSGKVLPHIIYSYFMGLINYKKERNLYFLSRTKLGENVYKEDPGLQEKLSVLLCHCMMLRKKRGALMWCVIFKEILPMYRNGIKKEIIIKILNQENYFNGKMVQKQFAPFTSSYLLNGFFSPLNILEDKDQLIKIKMNQYTHEFAFLYAYILWIYWEELFPKQEEITSNELEELSFGKAFGWNMQEEYDALQHLSDEGLLQMNRQLMPYTILKLVDKDTIIERLYSRLL